jgi:methionyl-tRNA formyltransferase
LKPVVVLSGQKWFGCEVLNLLVALNWRVIGVAAPVDDRLWTHARQYGLPTDSPAAIERLIPDGGADLLVCADHRDHLPKSTRERFAMGALAFHGSLLPRHRGGSAVEWTVRFGDKIGGGSIYWMDDGMDTGPLAAQQSCHVMPGEDAAALWRRAIAPVGLKLFRQVFADLESGKVTREPQEEFAATWEPALRTTKS